MRTFSYRPERVVLDSAGNVRQGINLTVRAPNGGATITALETLQGVSLPGFVTTDGLGRFPFRINSNTYDQVTIVTPDGDSWDITADEVMAAIGPTEAQVVTMQAEVDQLQIDLPAAKPSFRGNVASQAAMVALSSAVKGDWCIRTDVNARFDLTGTVYSVAANWTQVPGGTGTTNASDLTAGTLAPARMDAIYGAIVPNTLTARPALPTGARCLIIGGSTPVTWGLAGDLQMMTP